MSQCAAPAYARRWRCRPSPGRWRPRSLAPCSVTKAGSGLVPAPCGVPRGATWVAILTAPFVICVLTADDAEGVTDLHLAGLSWRERYLRGILAALLLTSLGIAAGCVFGSLTGLGDALRSSGLPSQALAAAPALPWELVLVAVLLACAATASGASTVMAAAASMGSLVLFVVGLSTTCGSPVRQVLAFLPWAPAWDATASWPAARFSVLPPPGGWLPVILVWVCFAALVTAATRRR